MLFDLNQQAAELPEAWRSAVLGRVGAANIKVLRMDARSIADEVHDYSEGLLVISGHLRLQVAGEEVVVRAGRGRRAAPRVAGQRRHAGDCRFAGGLSAVVGLRLCQKSDNALEKALSAGVISIEMDKMCRFRNDQLFG
ncbi:cupin domain protein [Serratia ureilytica]|nr:cupin domain protein [Serratia ureilytica]